MKNLKHIKLFEQFFNNDMLYESLNKDIKMFGQDLDKNFKLSGFDTLILTRQPSQEQLQTIKTNPKAVIFEVFQSPETQQLTLYVNPKQIAVAEKIINKFQISNYDGPILSRGWTSKQVKGAINPGDIVKQDSDKNNGIWYFYRLAKVNTTVKNIEQK